MRNRSYLGLLSAIMLSMVAVPALARVPKNAFIVRPAPTHAALMNQVRFNPTVRDRYLRHFAMPGPELDRYFASLTPGRITTTALFTVYNVPASGVLRTRLLGLRAGTPIWQDPQGRPILMEICGNPLTRGPRAPMDEATETQVVPETETSTLRILTREPDEAAEPELALMTPADPEVADSAPVLAVTGAEMADPSVATPAVSPSPLLSPTSTASTSPWAGLDSIPGALLALGGGAGITLPSFATTSNPQSPPRPASPEAVPEPATVTALLLGIGALSARRRRNLVA